MATIRLDFNSPDLPTGIVLTAIRRTDTGATVTLPAPATWTDEGSGTWSIEFDEPSPALTYEYEATVTWSDATTSAFTDTVNGDASGNPAGAYYTRDGIKNILGEINADVSSQLDSDLTTADLTRVSADGDLADAYTSRRARLAGHAVPLTADTTDDFPLVRFVTNLYASFLLVSHREWFADLSQDARDKAILSLEGRAMALYDALFGVDPTGIDGPGEETPTTWLEQLRGLAPSAGRTRTDCGRVITHDAQGNLYPTTTAGWYGLYPQLLSN